MFQSCFFSHNSIGFYSHHISASLTHLRHSSLASALAISSSTNKGAGDSFASLEAPFLKPFSFSPLTLLVLLIPYLHNTFQSSQLSY